MNETTVFTYENSIGKITFSYASDFWISDIDGVSSIEVDISASRSTGQAGSSIAGQSVQPRPIPVDGYIYEPLDINRARLIEVIAPEVPATLTVFENGESWYLDVFPKKTPNILPGNGLQYFQMELYSAYPYWRSTKELASMAAGLVAMFEFPFFTGGTWWISKFSEDYFTVIENHGNVPIFPTIIFTARMELARPEIMHLESGKVIRFKNSMVTGERMIVTTLYGQQGVAHIDRYGNITNGFRYLTMESTLDMALLPGENTLRSDAASNRQGLGVTFQHAEGEKSGV